MNSGYLGFLPEHAQTIIAIITYVGIAVGCAWFAFVARRKKAPTQRREPFRKPARVIAVGYLMLACLAVVVLALPQSGPAWRTLLASGWLAASIAVTWTGHRMYSRAADEYPVGKHAGPVSPSESRWPGRR
jgi:uncharacterized membrane protein